MTNIAKVRWDENGIHNPEYIDLDVMDHAEANATARALEAVDCRHDSSLPAMIASIAALQRYRRCQ